MATVTIDSPILSGTYIHGEPAAGEYVSPPSAPWFNGRKLTEYDWSVVEAALAALRLEDVSWRVAGRA